MRSDFGVSALPALSRPLGRALCRPLVAASGLTAFVPGAAQCCGRPCVRSRVQGLAQSVRVREHSDPFTSSPGGT